MLRSLCLRLGHGALLLLLLTGCAGVSRPRPIAPEACWTNPEQFDERTRAYAGVTEAQVLRASERLLTLSGGAQMNIQMNIQHAPHSVAAEFKRDRHFYAFLIAHSASVWDHWIVSTRPGVDGVGVCAQVTGQYFTDTFIFGAEPMRNAIYPASASEPDPGKGFKPPARAYPVDYDTFWSRLEYLLGLNPVWPRCPQGSAAGIVNHPARGRQEMNPLCHALADDPPEPK